MSWKLEAQPDVIRAGAGTTADAGELARTAAARLAEEQLTHGIFGDFDAAHNFHSTVSAAHGDHVERLNDHHTVLTDTSEKAHAVAQAFTDL